jgi:deoxycytidylate deaminase
MGAQPEAIKKASSQESVYPKYSNQELFIGLVSATGTDLSVFLKTFQERLKHFNYESDAIRLIEALHEIERWRDLPETPIDVRIKTHMDAGTEFRELLGRGEGLPILGIGKIMKIRKDISGAADKSIPRHAYIFHGLKNPSEVEVMRGIYGDGFILIGIYSPHHLRLDYLSRRIAESRNEFQIDQFRAKAEELIHRDQQEIGTKLGQNLRDTFHRADVFVNASEPDELRADIERFVDLLFGNSIRTPTRDEYGMFHAQAAALRSADLGRQVGAAIAAQDGDIISVGTNEVPKAGGGLYWTGDVPDQRDFVLGYDSNDKSKRSLLADLFERLKKEDWFSDQLEKLTTEELLTRAIGTQASFLRKAQFMNLIEFGRAVHAEMAALTDAARRGVSTKDATLYCTTFPCHICAKHIVSAGIRRVVYIEPYPKSLATQLYPDSITVEPATKEGHQVHFEPFVGISPLQYMNLFSMLQRKDGSGVTVTNEPHSASPRCQSSPPTYLRNEMSSLVWLEKAMKEKGLLREKGDK